MEEAFIRGWTNLIHRLDGPMHLRFIMQPAAALYLAIRAGVRDAAACETPFLEALGRRERVRERLRQGWRDVGKVFIVATLLDIAYQAWVQHAVYLLELVVTATLLALVPYALVRGPSCRIARAWLARFPRPAARAVRRDRQASRLLRMCGTERP